MSDEEAQKHETEKPTSDPSSDSSPESPPEPPKASDPESSATESEDAPSRRRDIPFEFMLLFVPPAKQSRVVENLSKLIHVPFKFESSGSQIIFFDQEADYSAEDRIRNGRRDLVFRELAVTQGVQDPSS